MSVGVFAQGSTETTVAETTAPPQSDTFAVIRTGSPRQTLQSLLDLKRETESNWHQYRQDRTRTNAFRVDDSLAQDTR